MANTVPPEILHKIFDIHGRHQAHLLSCARVCRAWYEPAKELLYRKICLPDDWVEDRTKEEGFTYCAPDRARLDRIWASKLARLEEGSWPGEPDPGAMSMPSQLSNLLHDSLVQFPSNGRYIRYLDIRSASAFAVLAFAPSLRSLLAGWTFELKHGQAGTDMPQKALARDISLFIPDLPHLQNLHLANISRELAVQLLSRCPNVETIEFFVTKCWEPRHWLQFAYPVIPPLRTLVVIAPGPVSLQAFGNVVGPVSHTLEALVLNAHYWGMDATLQMEDGELDSSSSTFWDGLRFRKLRHLQLSAVDPDGVCRLLGMTQSLEFLDLRNHMDQIDIYTFLLAIPSPVISFGLFFVSNVSTDQSIAEAFILCLQDPAWRPHLKHVPQIWTLNELDSAEKVAYLERSTTGNRGSLCR